MRCSSAIYIADLCLYARQNLVGIHDCPTLVHAARLPSKSPTSVRTRCRTSLVFTTVLHSYALLVCRQHRRTPFVRIAEPRLYVPLSYIRTHCTSALYIATYTRTRCRTSLVFTAVLHSYALLVCRQHRRAPFVRVAESRWYSPLSYLRTRGTSAVYIADLRSYALHVCRLHRDLCSYALQNLVGIHRCPTFVCAARLPSTSPTSIRTRCRTSLVCTMSDICMSSASAAITAGYIRTRCSSAVNIAELRSYALQNLVCMCRCPRFVGAARLPSTSPTSVRTRCRTSLVCTAVLHS